MRRNLSKVSQTHKTRWQWHTTDKAETCVRNAVGSKMLMLIVLLEWFQKVKQLNLNDSVCQSDLIKSFIIFLVLMAKSYKGNAQPWQKLPFILLMAFHSICLWLERNKVSSYRHVWIYQTEVLSPVRGSGPRRLRFPFQRACWSVLEHFRNVLANT